MDGTETLVVPSYPSRQAAVIDMAPGATALLRGRADESKCREAARTHKVARTREAVRARGVTRTREVIQTRGVVRTRGVARMKVAVIKESAPGERRVALAPDAVTRLSAKGLDVLVESGAGDGAWFPDSAYAQAGATVVSRDELLAGADAIIMVGKPDTGLVPRLRSGQAVIGMLAPLTDPELAATLAKAGVTAISLDGLPRTLSRAQQMDALTSQSNVAGYKAVLIAAAFGRFFPLLITAAGTAKPAKLLVLGTGVAGLQAIGTARRLGAVVSGYDVRPSSKSEVESLGATFLELKAVTSAAGEGG